MGQGGAAAATRAAGPSCASWPSPGLRRFTRSLTHPTPRPSTPPTLPPTPTNPTQPDHYDKGYTPRIPGERLSASYINHYKANGGAVLSRFGAGAAMADQRALDILGEAYQK